MSRPIGKERRLEIAEKEVVRLAPYERWVMATVAGRVPRVVATESVVGSPDDSGDLVSFVVSVLDADRAHGGLLMFRQIEEILNATNVILCEVMYLDAWLSAIDGQEAFTDQGWALKRLTNRVRTWRGERTRANKLVAEIDTHLGDR